MVNISPKHIAIILDGNRRFAKKLLLQPWKGHEYGRKKVEQLIDYAKEYGINQLTLYCLSCENIKNRPKNELEYLYKIFKESLKNINREKLQTNKTKIRFIGKISLLPQDLQQLCKQLEQETQNNNNLIVNFAMAYGGRQEIIQAIKKILKNKISHNDIDEQVIEQNLYMNDEPDIIIRTGGEKRTSNFLPWQSSFSEWIFLDKLWPEFEKQDLLQCIEEFKQRKRNFGA